MKGYTFTTVGATYRMVILEESLSAAKSQLVKVVDSPDNWYYIGIVENDSGLMFDSGTEYNPDIHKGTHINQIQ